MGLNAMEKLEKAIKNILPKAVVRGELEPRTMYYDRLIEWVKTVQKNAQKVEVEFVAFKKDYDNEIHMKRKQLEEFDVIRWLDQNYPNKERSWHSYGADFVSTFRLFIKKELLGVEKTS